MTSVSPSAGSGLGGTPVTVTGTNLSGSTFSFGSHDAGQAICSATSCTATSPASAAGVVDVVAENGDGKSSAASSADRFTYSAGAAVITGIAPNAGPVVGAPAWS